MDRQAHDVVRAAVRWALFQQRDSLVDQESDVKLRFEADGARVALLRAVDELPDDWDAE